MPLNIQQRRNGEIVSRDWSFSHVMVAIEAAEAEGKKEQLLGTADWVTFDQDHDIEAGPDFSNVDFSKPLEQLPRQEYIKAGDEIRVWR